MTRLRGRFTTKNLLDITLFQVVGMFVGLIYLQQSYNQKGVQNIDGALFMMQMMITFNTMFAVLSVSTSEFYDKIFIIRHSTTQHYWLIDNR